jgi:hypothetical protein
MSDSGLSWRVKAAGAKADNLTTFMCPCKSKPSTALRACPGLYRVYYYYYYYYYYYSVYLRTLSNTIEMQ